jgi:dephospho-CoA kinase
VATGKSTVLAALAGLGVPTIDLDAICRELVAPGRPELERLKAEFGAEFVPGGRLDRARLRELISRDEEARARLTAILHPPVLAEMERRLSGLAAAGHKLAAVEVALLYEGGYASRFDAVIVAACPPEVALERLVERSGLSEEEAQRLTSAQLPLEEKRAKADHVVDTSGSRESVARQVEQILHHVLRGVRQRPA